jgi:hypothetical protein
MEWREDGILIAVRRHGETAAILEVFTNGHGRHVGVVPGGASRRMAPILQPGAQLDVTWRARLSDHIGSFRVEPILSRAADVMGDRLALAGLGAVCALLSFCLPERAPYPALYARASRFWTGWGRSVGAMPISGGNWRFDRDGVRPVVGGLRGHGIAGGSGLRLAAHGPRGVACRRGGLVRPPAALTALSHGGPVRLDRGASVRAAHDGALPVGTPRAVARGPCPALGPATAVDLIARQAQAEIGDRG